MSQAGVAPSSPDLPDHDRLASARRALRGRHGAAHRIVTVSLGVAVAGVALATIMRAIPYDAYTPAAQFVSFTPWIAAGALVVLGLTAVAGRWRLTIMAAVCVLTHVIWIAPFFIPGDTPGSRLSPTNSVRVMSVNALYGQADAEQIVRVVREQKVDVLVVLELTDALRERLDAAGLNTVLSYHLDARVAAGAAGSGLWADRELTEPMGDGPAQVAEPLSPNSSSLAMPSAVIQVGGVAMRVTAAHPLPPTPGEEAIWHQELTQLGQRMARDPMPQIVAGDFNATYDHATFRRLLGGRFQDATRTAGRGLKLSWSPMNVGPGFPLVDIDHIVTEGGAAIADVASLPISGSDHRAIVATICPEGGRD